VEVSDDGVDLFVFGRDFYLGSASKTIENGWCEFEALGLEQAKAAFGSSRRLGTVWYLAERVPSDALRSLEKPLEIGQSLPLLRSRGSASGCAL
jgi:hypothetical protein